MSELVLLGVCGPCPLSKYRDIILSDNCHQALPMSWLTLWKFSSLWATCVSDVMWPWA